MMMMMTNVLYTQVLKWNGTGRHCTYRYCLGLWKTS